MKKNDTTKGPIPRTKLFRSKKPESARDRPTKGEPWNGGRTNAKKKTQTETRGE